MKDLSIMIDNVKFNYRVGLLIERNNKILVECNPEFNFVGLPGGRVKTLESSILALLREIKEEMGIELTKDEVKRKAIIENFFEFDGIKHHELLFLYRLKVGLQDKRFKEEMKNLDSKDNYYKWVDKDKLEGVNLVPHIVIDMIGTNKFEMVTVNDL